MRVLFLSRGNAGRGAMAEGLAKQMFSDFTIESAGLTPQKLCPHAVTVMREINIDIAHHTPRAISEVDIKSFDLVILVGGGKDLSDAAVHASKRLQWPLMDPLDPPAGEAELQKRFRDTRTALSKHLKALGKIDKKAL